MRTSNIVIALIALIAAALTLSSTSALAQTKPTKPYDPAVQKDKPQGQWKAKPNQWNASTVTKEMLLKHGYKVVGAEQLQDGNVIYFRRDGVTSVRDVSVEKVTIRLDGERVAIDGAPRAVLADVKAKLELP